MSSENKFAFFKNLFAGKKQDTDMRTDETDDYTVKRNQRTDVIIRILAFIGAVLIWVYAVFSDVSSFEFRDMAVKVTGIEVLEAEGYTVSYKETFVTFRVQGSADKISLVTEDSATVTADLSDIDTVDIVGQKIVNVPLTFEIPKGLTRMEQSASYIEVVISVSANAEGLTECLCRGILFKILNYQ